MNFRLALHDVANNAQDNALRLRAIETIGNISTRYGDFIQSFYDMQLLTRMACKTPDGDIAGAAVTAICKIAACPTLRPAPDMNTEQFSMGNDVEFRSRMSPHGSIGRRAKGGMSANITYPEVAIAVTAHVLMTNESPKARLTAAENLRKIAWEHRNDAEKGGGDLRSLVVQFVNEHRPAEDDPQVMSVLDKTVGLDYRDAEREKDHAVQDLADQLAAQTRAAETEQREAATTVRETIKVSKPLTFKKAASTPTQTPAPKKRWWGLRQTARTITSIIRSRP
jgi:hypothetical protein